MRMRQISSVFTLKVCRSRRAENCRHRVAARFLAQEVPPEGNGDRGTKQADGCASLLAGPADGESVVGQAAAALWGGACFPSPVSVQKNAAPFLSSLNKSCQNPAIEM